MLPEAAPLACLVGLVPCAVAALVSDLARAQLTVACAESLTGGLLTALITETPGASAVLRGGLVVYATELKHSLAGVDAALLEAKGPVDPEVAIALARGARAKCGSAVGLGLTGVAGPDPQNGVAVGTWYVAIATEQTSKVVAHLPASAGNDEPAYLTRSQVRSAAVRAAVELLTELTRAHPSI